MAMNTINIRLDFQQCWQKKIIFTKFLHKLEFIYTSLLFLRHLYSILLIKTYSHL